VTLRRAAEADCELLWRWANDPVARSASFDSRSISWSNHVAWFRAQRNDPRSRIYVIEESARPVGVIRFERRDSGEAIVSINIAPDERGRGLGAEALRQGCTRVFEEDAVSSVIAYIKSDNVASMRTFSQAGFTDIGPTRVRDAQAVTMQWTPHGGPADR
jgi:UDP-2,4-diacetamido-2,4,6-trideoxy-beta-L-altropyranose hydrolase